MFGFFSLRKLIVNYIFMFLCAHCDHKSQCIASTLPLLCVIHFRWICNLGELQI